MLDQPADKPSKTARKRAALAAQALGVQLLKLTDAELARLGLPETLVDALRAARQIRARGGRARQLQYIGKLMRQVDIGRIQQSLVTPARVQAHAAAREKDIEQWRERLLREGAAALDALHAARPGGDLAAVRSALDDARNALQSQHRRLAARRRLFRALRELLTGSC